MKIFFYTVKTNALKVRALLQTVDKHLAQKEKLQILAPDAALPFLSDLLWNQPLESFRPHSLHTPSPFQDLILLSSTPHDYPFLFNLLATPLPPSTRTLYELEDLTTPEKASFFQKKFQTYQRAGLQLTSLPLA